MPTPKPAGQMIVLTPDGERVVSSAKRMPGLGKLQKAVGGTIQVVPLFETFEGERCLAFCNEEGKLEGLRVNRQASEAWLATLEDSGNVPMFTDDLCGPVVILTGAATKD